MSTPKQLKTISLLRNLYRELRPTLYHDEKYVFQSSPMWQYIIQLSRRFQVQDIEKQPLTNETKNLLSIGHSYLSYLKSNRRYAELNTKYQGKGELTPEETATRVGFRLPPSQQFDDDDRFQQRYGNSAGVTNNPNRMPIGGSSGSSASRGGNRNTNDSSSTGRRGYKGYPRDPDKSSLESWEDMKSIKTRARDRE